MPPHQGILTSPAHLVPLKNLFGSPSTSQIDPCEQVVVLGRLGLELGYLLVALGLFIPIPRVPQSLFPLAPSARRARPGAVARTP